MEWHAKWIAPQAPMGRVCPVYQKQIFCKKPVASAMLYITAAGVYEARLNGARIGEFILAPGWTSYQTRHQYQAYELLPMLSAGTEHLLEVTVGEGWYRGRLAGWTDTNRSRYTLPAALIAELHITYQDGETETVPTDGSWRVSESPLRFCDLYDGELFDASFSPADSQPVRLVPELTTNCLIPQEGEDVTEQEQIRPVGMIRTPRGETVLDFGQNLTGYVSFSVRAKKGDRVRISHAEILDRDGNFYTENYRSAKATLTYLCRDGAQSYKPSLTFYGFRYIRLDEFPGEPDPEAFTAIVLHSRIRRTGFLSCSNPLLNQLFENIVWGQKGNFVDVPTDCPQRDERLGWTGDAQVFIRTASYQFDVLRFFRKWLRDLSADQKENGHVPAVIPAVFDNEWASAAWGDAACVCPWQLYLTYGEKQVLEEQFNSMRRWVDYITAHTQTDFLWTGTEHYGDWLGLDACAGSYKGSSDPDLIASAFYFYSTTLVVKAGTVLGKDVKVYAGLAEKIREAFQRRYPACRTQTEYTLAIHFGLSRDPLSDGQKLAELVIGNGNRLTTGFVGTPYLLHALSETGHTEVAYSLLLQEQFPSWLFSVKQGATTVWEHWDGMNAEGSLWSSDMNSFNHYAYGAVADWVYGVAAGIQTVEEAPGFASVRFCPHPDRRLQSLCARIETAHGSVCSKWHYTGKTVRYEITTPTSAVIQIGNRCYSVEKGTYLFYSQEA